MEYPRPSYLEPGVKTEKVKMMFSNYEAEIPCFDTPVTPLENFMRCASRKDTLWTPNSLTDVQSLMVQDIVESDVRGMRIGVDFHRRATENYLFTDWFNTSWTWVCSAGGAMLTPGTMLLDDITKWESVVSFPDLSEWDFKTPAEKFMKEDYNPKKVLHINLGLGCTERLISILGGYTEGMLALAVEPEAVSAFLDRFADHMIEMFDLLCTLYPVNMVTYHDDWGTERETFFSERMFEDIVYAPTKRIVDHVRSKGVIFELHSCGNITRFLPYMVDLNIDFLQIQRRAVDIPAMKLKYGDRIGFNSGLEGVVPGVPVSNDEIKALVRNTVELYGKGGGFYTMVFDNRPEGVWNAVCELYAYSREFYDKERGEL